MLLQQLTLADQQIYVFDLQLPVSQRVQRRQCLDSELTDYFFDNNQLSYIWHQAGKPAQLRLESIATAYQSTNEQAASNVLVDNYQLAISYGLPLAAVCWSKQPIGMDMCDTQAFLDMDDTEQQTFCQTYFPDYLDTLQYTQRHGHAKDKYAQISEQLAKQWSIYEAKLKFLQRPLQTYSAELAQAFLPLSEVSQKIITQHQHFWLTLVC